MEPIQLMSDSEKEIMEIIGITGAVSIYRSCWRPWRKRAVNGNGRQ